jgi:hypothetical protein
MNILTHSAMRCRYAVKNYVGNLMSGHFV